MLTLKEIALKRISQIQIINSKLNFPSSLTPFSPTQFPQLRNRLMQQQLSRQSKEDDTFSYLKGIYLHTNQEQLNLRQIFNLTLFIMTSLEFDIPELDLYVGKQFQEDSLLSTLVEIFSIFFGFLSKYFDLRDNYKTIFRTSNKTLALDIVKYLSMFIRDYFQHTMVAAEKVFQPESKDVRVLKQPIGEIRHNSVKKILYRNVTESSEIIKPPKNRHIRTQSILDIEENRYHPQYMDSQEIVQMSIAEFQFLKRRNSAIYLSRTKQQAQPNVLKIKVNIDGLYTKEEILRFQEERCDAGAVRVFVNEKKRKEKYEMLRRFAEEQLKKEAEFYKRVKVNNPKKLSSSCKFALKLTNKIEKPLELILFQPHFKKIASMNRFPYLKTTPSVSVTQKKKQLILPTPKQQREVTYSHRNSKEVRRAPKAIQTIVSERKNSILQKQYSLPRCKVIRMKSNTILLPSILKKLGVQKPSKNESQDEGDDNVMRDVMSFNKLRRPEKQKGLEKNLMEIVSRQVTSIYI